MKSEFVLTQHKTAHVSLTEEEESEMKTVSVCPWWPAMQPMEWCPMARGLAEMMWPCMRWWASQCHLQPPDPLQTIPLTTSSPPRDLLPSHTTLRTLPMMSLLILGRQMFRVNVKLYVVWA